MSKRTTNILGIVIAIVAGTYFNLMLCNTCSNKTDVVSSVENTADVTNNSILVEEEKESTEP